ncbi:MAG: 1-(5-phosphoribosyl)-5-[(5-phosphoribosylamino)methylideneamino]imidazole-4-carboxamide isomerase [Chloroflexi bacterium]|nr:1-(5-phosphoribosyl)-5-[(5-phosphoribosylamino)methylideneamino]imidazole-4-carboxamide isomerase [Chloroflexota bacterium]
MEVIPAIDLKDGRCVRLYQGDFTRESVYSDDPAAVARRWEEEGAVRLHVVDLDGAAEGRPRNAPLIEGIVKAVEMPVQVGGGIRSLQTLAEYLDMGVQRVVLGTSAVEDADLVEEACRRYGEAVVIGVDARDGYVATSGWTRGTRVLAVKLVAEMEGLGARRFIYTDIARDGTLTGPNLDGVAHILSLASVPVIASGGISSIEHLVELQGLGVEGAIVGRALYTGDVDLGRAIERVSRESG